VPSLETAPFSHDHLDAAATLLAARHARHRAAEPLLPARFEDPRAARGAIEELLAADGASGAVALRAGRVVAYVVGIRKSDDVWRPNVWIDPAGHAAEEPEHGRDAYAAAAAGWVDEGRRAHYAVVPATDAALVDAWFRLGFGHQQALAVRELRDGDRLPAGVREAGPRDVDVLLELAPAIADVHLAAPVFSGMPADYDEDELRADIENDVASPSIGTLVAEIGGRVAGNFVVVPAEGVSQHSGLPQPERACYLAWAATAPWARGSGAGVALSHGAFAWARAHGFEVMVTDWRVTNLLSSRFWPQRGFRPTFFRLHRTL
jgi:GNAT superfamily N-acetyltransferase